ncbi:MAG TPA: 16S rRNA (cytosine(1402)-N(4))-methyltransferase RsmH [bacterium]|nr:16S rRNA (cytosine(1402)-N(4))-methyltransferase RsmH [bacterium]
MEILHYPVLKEQVLHYLNIKKGGIYIDATCGRGGHSGYILKSDSSIFLYGIDKDMQAIREVSENLSGFENFKALHCGFENIDNFLEQESISRIDGILFDIGFSTNQIKDSERGFSFQTDGPIDMRYDTDSPLTAWEIINKWDRNNLIWIMENFGEIRNAKKLADAIILRRKRKNFTTTLELADFISGYYGYRKKIHPATKVFMSLRIAVNNELASLAEGLKKAEKALSSEGRLVVISFHSLEDRIVKKFMRGSSDMTVLTKKPVTADEEELQLNPESRSAKLRAAEKK